MFYLLNEQYLRSFDFAQDDTTNVIRSLYFVIPSEYGIPAQ